MTAINPFVAGNRILCEPIDIRLTPLKFLVALVALMFVPVAQAAAECDLASGQWLDPASGKPIESSALFERLARADVVLLGESHTIAAHHRWQAYMLSALHAHRPAMQIGFEMFPRAAQPVLDRWSAGELTESQMLEQTDWRRVWGYGAEYYLPLLHFARLHRLPALGLNVQRELVGRVGQEGWDAIPEDAREGVGDPAPASPAYQDSLADLFLYKRELGAGGHGKADTEERREVMRSAEFQRFVEAQLTWDRAMAEVLAAAHQREPDALIVGIVGQGHLEYGHGIPHQLADLGIDAVQVLLPRSRSLACTDLPAELADAVFMVDVDKEDPPAGRPLLGVMIEDGDAGVSVREVVAGSVAERSGLLSGDLIQSAAGFKTATTSALIEVIARQAPGTWLPLEILRDGKTVEITARFPQVFE